MDIFELLNQKFSPKISYEPLESSTYSTKERKQVFRKRMREFDNCMSKFEVDMEKLGQQMEKFGKQMDEFGVEMTKTTGRCLSRMQSVGKPDERKISQSFSFLRDFTKSNSTVIQTKGRIEERHSWVDSQGNVETLTIKGMGDNRYSIRALRDAEGNVISREDSRNMTNSEIPEFESKKVKMEEAEGSPKT